MAGLGEVLETEITAIVQKAISEHDRKISTEEIQMIVQEVTIHLDNILNEKVAHAIRTHLKAIAEYTLQTFR